VLLAKDMAAQSQITLQDGQDEEMVCDRRLAPLRESPREAGSFEPILATARYAPHCPP
jgi:hypothetical protein